MTYPGKTRRIKMIAAVMATVMAVVTLGVGGNVLAGQETSSVFKASFSGLKDGTISTEDTATVAALEKNFYIYNYQRVKKNGQAAYFERNEVNGYLVEGDSSSDRPKFPDTGATIPGKELDGYGNAQDKPIPMWSIEKGWLSCNAYNGEDAFLFRQGNLLYVKDDTVTSFAAIKDFQLDMDFKFATTAENDALAVLFHAKDAGMVINPNQCVLAFNADGKVYFGKPKNFETAIAYNGKLNAINGSTVKFEKDHAYALSLTVVGRSMSLTIKDGKTEIATYQDSALPVTEFENGYLAIALSNNGPAIADIQVQKLDATGAATDFSNPVAGYSFGFIASTLADYRSYYCANFGAGTQKLTNTWYFRNNNDLYWYDYVSSRDENNYKWLGDKVTAVRDKVDSLFVNYREQISTTSGKRLFAKAAHFSDRVADWAELNLGDGQLGAEGGLIARKYLLMRQADQWTDKLLSQATTIAPKTTSGEQIITRNFETTFGVFLYNNPETAFTLSFRSASPSAMINSDASAGYADKVTVVISGAGYKILDGEALSLSGNELTPWNGGTGVEGSVHITVKVVGNRLILKVTNDAGDVYLDNSAAPAVLSTDRVGYVYYSALNCWGHLSDLGFARLDDDGNRADVNQNPGIEIVRAEYSPVSVEIDRSKGQSFADIDLPTEIAGTTKDGNTFLVPVVWANEEYRSYKDGVFEFLALPASGGVKFAAGVRPVATVVNKIENDYDTTTSRKYYFDSENDLKDFLCHISSVKPDNTSAYFDVTMDQVAPQQYWSIQNGMIRSNYSRAGDGYNGLNRANDVSTMVLADKNLALVNFQIDIDYTHGSSWWWPTLLTNVQDPAQFNGKLYIPNQSTADLTTGVNTEIDFDHKTNKAGVWIDLEESGGLLYTGAVKTDENGRVVYQMDIEDGQDFVKTYDRNKQHHLTIRAVNGLLSVQFDNKSDVYYAELSNGVFGGFAGFASYGNYVSYDNFMITALDAEGQPMPLANAETGVTPELLRDTYTGWQPLETDWAFDWKSPFIF